MEFQNINVHTLGFIVIKYIFDNHMKLKKMNHFINNTVFYFILQICKINKNCIKINFY